MVTPVLESAARWPVLLALLVLAPLAHPPYAAQVTPMRLPKD